MSSDNQAPTPPPSKTSTSESETQNTNMEGQFEETNRRNGGSDAVGTDINRALRKLIDDVLEGTGLNIDGNNIKRVLRAWTWNSNKDELSKVKNDDMNKTIRDKFVDVELKDTGKYHIYIERKLELAYDSVGLVNQAFPDLSPSTSPK